MNECLDCGGALPDGASFCPHCGHRVATPDLPVPGDMVGRYRVTRRIGEGGMATVYQALDEELGRQVALKVLTGDAFAEEEARARFQREARITSSFEHPNAVTVYDYLLTDAGYPCLVLELVLGVPLAAALQAGPFDTRRAFSIARQVLDVLAEAEARELVHRDITATNILLVGASDRERIKLLDFGIAKHAGPSRAGPLTVLGQVVGSPTYMSPEQCRGEDLDTRSDLYSLGIVLYEMLAGTVPFAGDSHVEVLRQQIHDSPPPLPPHVPPGVARLVEKALAKERNARYQTASEFQQALDGVAADSATPGALRLESTSGHEPVLLDGATVLGRGENVGALISGPGSELVSANHAEVTVAGTTVRVRDLGSTNGTYVNGRRVRESELVDGDVLRLALRGPEYRVTVPTDTRRQMRTRTIPAGRHDRPVPGVASRFRRWLGLSTR